MLFSFKQLGVALMCGLLAVRCEAADRCTFVHGELDVWNGTPSLRIQSGQKVFGIVDSATHPLPPNLAGQVDFGHSAIGDFTPCELGQAKPDGMIYVWIKRAKDVRIIQAP